VRAESAGEGRGTTFTVELPVTAVEEAALARRTDEDARASEPAPAPYGRLEGLRVLVVDDEPDALDVVRRVLEDAGAMVATAGSADEALERLSQQVDVILSDIGMPGTDGYAFLGEVRRRGIATPAGALTAFTRVEDRQAALQAGFQRHIPKPAEPGELLRAVLELARRARQNVARPSDAGA
jgi:CheY-like chemotaxis protein